MEAVVDWIKQMPWFLCVRRSAFYPSVRKYCPHFLSAFYPLEYPQIRRSA